MQPALSPIEQAANDRETKFLWLAFALVVLASTVGGWAWSQFVQPIDWAYATVAIAGFLSVPGKFVVFWGCSKTSPLGPWGLVVLGMATDLAFALGLAALLAPLGRLPRIGPWLKRAHDRAATVLREYPGLGRMAFVGVTLFVFLPLPGTGVIGGTFAGQLLGLTRLQTIGAIGLGSLTTLILFAGLADAVGAEAQSMLANPWLAVSSAVLLALVVVLAYRRVRTVLRRG